MKERRAERECQRQNERDGGQSTVGDRLTFAVFGFGSGAVPASVQKAMLEGPVLCQIIPAVVFLFPAVMPEPTDQLGGKSLRVQGSNPEPFVVGGLGLKLAPSVMILRELLFGPYDPYGLGMIGGKR